eukprot:7825421-Heterocapsa_arctica.AAC.1
MEHAKKRNLGSKRLREAPGRRFGQGRRARTGEMEVKLDIRQETRRQEVLRTKPQVFKQASQAELGNRLTQANRTYGSESRNTRDVYDMPRKDRGTKMLHWLTQRDMNRIKTMGNEFSAVLQEHRPDNKLRQDKWRTGLYEENCERQESNKLCIDKTREYRFLSTQI